MIIAVFTAKTLILIVIHLEPDIWKTDAHFWNHGFYLFGDLMECETVNQKFNLLIYADLILNSGGKHDQTIWEGIVYNMGKQV